MSNPVNRSLEPEGDCPKCGREHDPRKCTSHVEACRACGVSDYQRADEPCSECGGPVLPRPCRAWPIAGGHVCPSHGGRTPNGQAAARERLVTAELMATLREVEVQPIGNLIDELVAQIARTKAWMTHLGTMVAELTNDEYRHLDDRGAEQLDARVKLFTDLQLQLHRQLVDGAKLNLDERRVRLDEIRVARVGALLEAWAGAHGIDLQARDELVLLDRLLPILDGAPVPAIDVTSTEEVG